MVSFKNMDGLELVYPLPQKKIKNPSKMVDRKLLKVTFHFEMAFFFRGSCW